MSIMSALQIMAILYFITAVRMRVWRTSLNTFVVISTIFELCISYEIPIIQRAWQQYHLYVIAGMMTFLMARVTYQSICTHRRRIMGGRRAEDKEY